jgi:hypothetical protein
MPADADIFMHIWSKSLWVGAEGLATEGDNPSAASIAGAAVKFWGTKVKNVLGDQSIKQ